ncbi:MAG: AzlC family ABC transporter permease [Huintestinicola sp.]
MKSQFAKGFSHGIPILLGYLTVSFGFGIAAVRSGLPIFAATAISMSCLTSAGQAAGLSIITAEGSLAELALSQLVINIRYALMGLSLSQKLDKSFTLPHRMLAAYGITDEIFAVASAQPHKIKPSYMYGLICAGFIGWSAGTLTGAAAGSILPDDINRAMGILLYGMFVAIVVPPSRKEKSILTAALIAAAASSVIFYAAPFISSGFSVIIAAVPAAAVCALLFPIKDDNETDDEKGQS